MKKIFLAGFLAIYGSTLVASKSPPTEVVSFNNDNKQFSCSGQNVEWFFPNNSKIYQSSEKFQIDKPSENESTLTVKNINAATMGVYRCKADGVSKEFDLKLFYPLAINFFNRLISVKENDNVTLKCKTISIPKVEKVTWYYEDKELVPDKDYIPIKDGIILTNVKAEQAGEYSCIAIQSIGSLKNVQQRDMELTVEYAPQQTSVNPTEIYGIIGETKSLTCEAKCQPAPTFKWTINNFETFENIYIRDYTSTLKVKIDSENDFQTYTCLASNDYGESEQIFILKQRVETDEAAASKTSSKTAGVILYTVAMLISTFIIY